MVFPSMMFLFIFLPFFLLIYYIVPKQYKNKVLLIGSLLFYAWGEPIYLFLIFFASYIDYRNGLRLSKNDNEKIRKQYLKQAIFINLCILGFFKYIDFFIHTINHLLGTHIPILELGLPIGISFYIFQTMSYSIDVYRKKIKPEGNYFRYLTYVSMFPQLVAGPIVRYETVQAELKSRVITKTNMIEGGTRFLRGLFKKVLLADSISPLWNVVSSDPSLSMGSAWLGILAFALQIYFDFSGYSDMAIGLGKMLGFHFLENFNYPYIATTITDFWRRWHISLSSWFRDYVYIPLGGNRCSKIIVIRNIMIIWLLTGLWHGASWNFVLWGIYFGLVLVIEKVFLKEKIKKWPTYLKHSYTIILLLISWVFFAIQDIETIKHYLQTMLGYQTEIIDMHFLYYLKSYGVLVIIGIILSTPILQILSRKYQKKQWIGGYVVKIMLYILAFILTIASIVSNTYQPFLYFRF